MRPSSGHWKRLHVLLVMDLNYHVSSLRGNIAGHNPSRRLLENISDKCAEMGLGKPKRNSS